MNKYYVWVEVTGFFPYTVEAVDAASAKKIAGKLYKDDAAAGRISIEDFQVQDYTVSIRDDD